MCTTGFLVDIAQNIIFGDLTNEEEEEEAITPTATKPPSLSLHGFNGDQPMIIINDTPQGEDVLLSRSDEDRLLKESTRSFADWVASFVNRVITVFENLPGEATEEIHSGGETEGIVNTHSTSYFQYNQIYSAGDRGCYQRMQSNLCSSY